jgi:hypothetical protein
MFKDKTDKDLIKQHGGELKCVYQIYPAVAVSLPQKAIDALEKNSKIEYIVPDLEVFTMGETLDWGVDRIDADIVHEYNILGTGVKVAIMDTGIDYNHLDLVDNYVWGYDFADYDDDPMDFNGHGTHCAGIVAAVDNEEGVIGVAPEANLYALKVFPDDGPAYYSYTISALEWCILTCTDENPDNDIQVISMSFGSSYSAGDPGIKQWIDDAYDAGILLVGAAGNDGNWFGGGDNVIYPARYDNVIAVAATDSMDGRAYWSSTGPDVELAAPGVNIYSTIPGGYGIKSGTSMACPMVSGTAALVIASDASLTNTEVRQRLQETADDLGAPGKDDLYGHGLVDADEAALPTGNQPPVADAGENQTVSDADGNGVEAVTLDGSGSSDPDPDGSIVSYEWKEGTTPLSDTVSFTSDFSVGTHTVTLTVTDNGGANSSDDVIVTVNANQAPVADAGADQTVSDADGNGVEAVTLDGSGSSDPDGSIDIYEWKEGATPLSDTVSFTSDFSVGTHTVTLTVTDDDGANSSDDVIVTVTETPANAMHVASIEMSTTKYKAKGWFTHATATVTIVDANDNPVKDAKVSGTWSGLTDDSNSGTTDGDGKVALDSDSVKNARGTFTFTVDDIAKTDWAYNSTVNVETSDSITV